MQINVTTNYDDVLIDGPFLEGGGVPKMKMVSQEKLRNIVTLS